MDINDILVIDYNGMRDKVESISESEFGKYFDSNKINRIIGYCENKYLTVDEMKDTIEIELDNFEVRIHNNILADLDIVREITKVYNVEAGISYSRDNKFGINADFEFSKEGRIAAFIAAGYDLLDDEFAMPDVYDTRVYFNLEIAEQGLRLMANVESSLGTERKTVNLTEEQELELYDIVIKEAVKDKSNAYNLAHHYLHSIATYQDYEITEDSIFENGLALIQYKDTEHEEVAMKMEIDLDNVLDTLPLGYPIKNTNDSKPKDKHKNQERER